MKSNVFSVLKIVLIAMMLVWAVSASAQSGPPTQYCNQPAELQCIAQMQLCTSYCGPQPSENPWCVAGCYSYFYSCMAQADCL